MGRHKIKLEGEVEKFIIDCYYSNVHRLKICEMLETKYKIKCSDHIIHKKYKELGLNGLKKKRYRPNYEGIKPQF